MIWRMGEGDDSWCCTSVEMGGTATDDMWR
jgi:hypothetical protein